jgi:hypothetical protein
MENSVIVDLQLLQSSFVRQKFSILAPAGCRITSAKNEKLNSYFDKSLLLVSDNLNPILI